MRRAGKAGVKNQEKKMLTNNPATGLISGIRQEARTEDSGNTMQTIDNEVVNGAAPDDRINHAPAQPISIPPSPQPPSPTAWLNQIRQAWACGRARGAANILEAARLMNAAKTATLLRMWQRFVKQRFVSRRQACMLMKLLDLISHLQTGPDRSPSTHPVTL
jgi:hypothetical protein